MIPYFVQTPIAISKETDQLLRNRSKPPHFGVNSTAHFSVDLEYNLVKNYKKVNLKKF